MPTVKLDETLEMYYEDDDFTDPWRTPETVVLHHGNAKSSRLWYAWVPLLARQYRVIRVGEIVVLVVHLKRVRWDCFASLAKTLERTERRWAGKPRLDLALWTC